MNSDALQQALSGAILLAYVVVALFFLRFWKKTFDRLFLLFSVAFSTLAVERFLLILVDPTHELRPYVYSVRLVAFVLILAAILDKNRKLPPDSGSKRSGQEGERPPGTSKTEGMPD